MAKFDDEDENDDELLRTSSSSADVYKITYCPSSSLLQVLLSTSSLGPASSFLRPLGGDQRALRNWVCGSTDPKSCGASGPKPTPPLPSTSPRSSVSAQSRGGARTTNDSTRTSSPSASCPT